MQNSNEQYQVIIVGAGPSGAACAKALSNNGISVLILEKESLPRHKICSGILFGQTQELLKKYFSAEPPPDVFCEPRTISASQIVEWTRDKGFIPYTWELPKDGHEFPKVYYNVWRNKFDHWLVNQAAVPVKKNCLVRTFSSEGNQITVTVFQKDLNLLEPPGGNPNQQLSCEYLVGADGGSSTVRRIIDPSWLSTAAAVTIYQVYCPVKDTGNLKDGNWHVFFEPSVGEMLCCAHRKDSFLTLCVGGFKGRNIRAGMETFKTFLNKNFHVVLDPEERVEGCVLRQSKPDLGRGKILITGEAAGFMYLNGEGISAAIDSGYRAGAALAQTIKHGGDALELYQQNTADLIDHMQLCMQNAHFLVV
jgi:flavin-dependent dehydrogenase